MDLCFLLKLFCVAFIDSFCDCTMSVSLFQWKIKSNQNILKKPDLLNYIISLIQINQWEHTDGRLKANLSILLPRLNRPFRLGYPWRRPACPCRVTTTSRPTTSWRRLSTNNRTTWGNRNRRLQRLCTPAPRLSTGTSTGAPRIYGLICKIKRI